MASAYLNGYLVGSPPEDLGVLYEEMFWDAEPFIPSSLILDKRSPATDVGMELLGPIRHQPQIRFLLLIIVLRRGGSRKIRSVVERSLPKRATGIREDGREQRPWRVILQKGSHRSAASSGLRLIQSVGRGRGRGRS